MKRESGTIAENVRRNKETDNCSETSVNEKKINSESRLQRWQALLSPNENKLRSLQELIGIAWEFDEENEMVLAQISDVQAEEFQQGKI